MALSLESIYKPVNDFFIDKFKTENDAPVTFGIQKNASVIDKEDFMNMNDPKEEFSDFVNKIPHLDENGNVIFLMNSIDLTYRQILNALPYVPDYYNKTEQENIEQIFIKAKAKAIKKWETAELVRSSGIADSFRYSDASPINWYDNKTENWEKRVFEIQGSSNETKDLKNKANFQVLKIRLSDEQLGKAMPMLAKAKPPKAVEMSNKAFIMNPIMTIPSTIKFSKPKSKSIIGLQKNSFKMNAKLFSRPTIVPINVSRKKKNRNKTKKTQMGMVFSNSFHQLRLNQKILVKDYIKSVSPTKPVNTNKVSISFEYCMISIRRPWFSEVLSNINKSWYIPGIAKGELTDPKTGGLSHLPIAFVAVKNLNIRANWKNTDKKELEKATSFGPFDINNHDLNEKGSLSHDGIQVIGWMLQKLPTLPPNEKI